MGRSSSKNHFKAGSCPQEYTPYCQYNIMWRLVTENYRGLLWEQNEPHKRSVGEMLRYHSSKHVLGLVTAVTIQDKTVAKQRSDRGHRLLLYYRTKHYRNVVNTNARYSSVITVSYIVHTWGHNTKRLSLISYLQLKNSVYYSMHIWGCSTSDSASSQLKHRVWYYNIHIWGCSTSDSALSQIKHRVWYQNMHIWGCSTRDSASSQTQGLVLQYAHLRLQYKGLSLIST
jgi:hypothetical protein